MADRRGRYQMRRVPGPQGALSRMRRPPSQGICAASVARSPSLAFCAESLAYFRRLSAAESEVFAWCYTRPMFARRGHWLEVVLLLAVVTVLAFLVPPPVRSQFTAKGVVDLDGKAVNPFRVATGKVVVFLFVRTDCPISNRYAPRIQEMSSRYGKGAEFFLVYPVRAETAEQIRSHLKEYGYRLAALRDPDGTLVRASDTRVTPEAAVFAPDGRLLYHGRIDDWYTEFGRSRPAPTTHELSSAIDAAIAQTPVAVPAQAAVGCFLPDRP
jgi:thiol-disulfide isomerase/thioredoxin